MNPREVNRLVVVAVVLCVVAVNTTSAEIGDGVYLHELAHDELRQGEHTYLDYISRHRDWLDQRFSDPELSPLTEADRENFTGLDYFSVDPQSNLKAMFVPSADGKVINVPGFGGGLLKYSLHGTLVAVYRSREIRLNLYRREDQHNVRHVALAPFTDPTNSKATYPGGRYLKYVLPLTDDPRIDFNKAVNPYCAYNATYACPIPPPENALSFPVRAGEKRFE